eukprot:Sdes_comp9096_c0_seq1m556
MSVRKARSSSFSGTEEVKYLQEVYSEIKEYDFLRKQFRPKVEEVNSANANFVGVSKVDMCSTVSKDLLRQVYWKCREALDLSEKQQAAVMQCIYALRAVIDLRLPASTSPHADDASGNGGGRSRELTFGTENTFVKGLTRRSAIINSLSGNLPKWNGRGVPPPLCGALPASPSYIVPIGDQVAALIPNSEGEQVWILGTVVSRTSLKYEVEDIVNEANSDSKPVSPARHFLTFKQIIPLPKWNAASPNLFHKKGSSVYALYPQTTCFYSAVVTRTPTETNCNYLIEFSDDEDVDGCTPDREIPQRFVLKVP